MQLKRFKDIVAVQSDSKNGVAAGIVAFHAASMEVAEVSHEAFENMTSIDLRTGSVPEITQAKNDAFDQLDIWHNEINPNVKSGKLDNKIQSLTININQICNLKCQYCAAGGDGSYGTPTNAISVETTKVQIDYFLKKLDRGQYFAVSFVGGEPLLHTRVLKALYDYIIDKTKLAGLVPSIKVVTNGTLLSEETLAILREMALELTISFDGIKSKNDSARPSKDGSSTTDKIVAGLEKLNLDRGQIRTLSFSSITTSDNTELFDNYIYLKSFNPDSMDFVFANDERSQTAQQKHMVGWEQILDHAWAKGGEPEIRKLRPVDQYFRQLDSQQQTENFCGAGKNYLMVDAKNRLYTCVWDANYTQELVGAQTTLSDEKIAKLSKPLIELNNCQSCWARHLCGGGCMHINRSHTGNKHEKSILFCERTRSLISLVFLYYKLSRASL